MTSMWTQAGLSHGFVGMPCIKCWGVYLVREWTVVTHLHEDEVSTLDDLSVEDNARQLSCCTVSRPRVPSRHVHEG